MGKRRILLIFLLHFNIRDTDDTIGGRLYQSFDQRLKTVEELISGMEDSPEKFELIGSLMLNLTRMREVAEYNKNVLVLTSLVCIEEEVETPANLDNLTEKTKK